MKISSMRIKYTFRLYFRIILLLWTIGLYFFSPDSFNVLQGLSFFRSFSPLHVIWLIWTMDIIFQLIPTKNILSIGSQKQFLKHFIEIINPKKAKEILTVYIKNINISGFKVLFIWTSIVLSIGLFVYLGKLGAKEVFLISTFFYVCDIICVLYWCPFKVWFLKNKCCSTCRIFNWDHLMMFSPLIFIISFYTLSLVFLSFLVFAVWEIFIILHPERFFEETNDALKCVNCKDKLCGKKSEAHKTIIIWPSNKLIKK